MGGELQELLLICHHSIGVLVGKNDGGSAVVPVGESLWVLGCVRGDQRSYCTAIRLIGRPTGALVMDRDDKGDATESSLAWQW